MKFKCNICNELNDFDDISFGSDAPEQWTLINEQERSLSELGEEQCLIISKEGTSYYIRARLEIPVIGRVNKFVWGVWCSLSENSMMEVTEYWEDPIRQHKGPYFGWLCTIIPWYPDTMYLKTMVHHSGVGYRPTVILEPKSHPLAVHQRDGVALDTLKEIIAKSLHH